MELVSMFLNQLTNNTNNATASNSTSNGFGDIFNNVENKKVDIKVKKNFKQCSNYNKQTNIPTYKNNQLTKDVVKKCKVEDNIDDNNVDKAIIIEKDTLDELSKVLKISPEKIMDILASLSLSVSMLQEPSNLTEFLQVVFNVEEPINLLSINNIKDIMKSVEDIAKNIDYTDTVHLDSEFDDKIKDIISNNNLKNVSLLNIKDENIKQKIASLLEDLNGTVEQNVTKINVSNINTKQNLEDETLNQDVEQLLLKDNKINDKPLEYYQSNAQTNNQNNFLGESTKQNVDVNIKAEVFNIQEVNNTKTFNISLPKTQVLKNINTTDVVMQIMEKIKVSVKPEISEVKMLLKPEQLGEITLKIATQNGIVTAQFVAESQKVKEIIEANFNQLKDILAEQGVNVGALEVNVSNSDEQQGKYNMFEQQNSNEKILQEETEMEKNNIKEEHIIDSQINYSI